MMAMKALDPSYMPDKLEEMKIWRRANLVFMGDGHAGCGPYGLALAAMQRGFETEIFEHNAQNLFNIWTESDQEATIQTLLDDNDRQEAIRMGCKITDHELTPDLVKRLVAEGRQLVTLTSEGLDAHWVILHDLQENNVFIIDPYKAEKEELSSIYRTDTGRNFIHYRDFKDWIKYGPRSSTVLLALKPK